jgi:hypothetical protein
VGEGSVSSVPKCMQGITRLPVGPQFKKVMAASARALYGIGKRLSKPFTLLLDNV